MEDSEDWERGMFNLINECYMSGTRIYLSSNTVTKDLTIRLADLASRLSSFTAIEKHEITDKENIMRGARAEVDFKNEISKMISGPTGKRVTGILTP